MPTAPRSAASSTRCSATRTPTATCQLRTFEHQRGAKPVEIRAVQINGEGLEPVVAQATGAANRAAKFERPTVFAPPVCTFRSATKAAEADLANGLCLAIECDEHPTEACRRLIGLLGGVTAIVASGGEWADPETGEIEPRLHVYVRLREPTRTPEEHAQLKRANRLAAALVGSDPRPCRWCIRSGGPGRVHRKGAPKLCRIADLHDEFEIDLADAEERLEQAARLALEHATGPDADRLRVALDIHEARASAPPPDFDPDDTRPGPRGPGRRDPQRGRAAGRVDQGRAGILRGVGRLGGRLQRLGPLVAQVRQVAWRDRAQWEHFAKTPADPDRQGRAGAARPAHRSRLPAAGLGACTAVGFPGRRRALGTAGRRAGQGRTRPGGGGSARQRRSARAGRAHTAQDQRDRPPVRGVARRSDLHARPGAFGAVAGRRGARRRSQRRRRQPEPSRVSCSAASATPGAA